MTKKKRALRTFAGCLLMLPVCPIILMSFGKKPEVVQPQSGYVAQNITVENIPDISPVDLTKVTKVVPYGEILDPRTNRMRNHTGIDFELNAGSDVLATADGVVVVQRYGDKRGNFVVIRHDETFRTRYSHLETAMVKEGDVIRKGQVIGLVGSTGILSTTPHLHYEILKNDTEVDPKNYLPAEVYEERK